MNPTLLAIAAACLLLWTAGLPLLWRLLRGTPEHPAPVRGLKAEALMLVHLLLLLLALCTLVLGSSGDF